MPSWFLFLKNETRPSAGRELSHAVPPEFIPGPMRDLRCHGTSLAADNGACRLPYLHGRPCVPVNARGWSSAVDFWKSLSVVGLFSLSGGRPPTRPGPSVWICPAIIGSFHAQSSIRRRWSYEPLGKSHIQEIKKALFRGFLWARQGSNLRPLLCQSSALTS